jgi:hypothetical protein
MGLIFAEAIVTGTVCLDMLQQFLESKLLENGILDTVVFQQDEAPCDYVQSISESVDWAWRNQTVGGKFSKFNHIRPFLSGIS